MLFFIMGIKLYRILEYLTGQNKGFKIIPYFIGQRIKYYLLLNWIK